MRTETANSRSWCCRSNSGKSSRSSRRNGSRNKRSIKRAQEPHSNRARNAGAGRQCAKEHRYFLENCYPIPNNKIQQNLSVGLVQEHHHFHFSRASKLTFLRQMHVELGLLKQNNVCRTSVHQQPLLFKVLWAWHNNTEKNNTFYATLSMAHTTITFQATLDMAQNTISFWS